MRYEIVRDLPATLKGPVQRHPAQPSDGFATAAEAAQWCETPPYQLSGEWYIRPIEAA